MSISAEQKSRIKDYLLEKISQADSSAVKKTAEAFSVTPATVYKYLAEMEESGTIRKIRRGTYELLRKEKNWVLHRSAGELSSEDVVFERLIRPELKDLPRNVIEIWEYIFGEMFNNIIDHSGAENVTIHLSRDLLKTTIHLTDDGVGIFEKIRSYFGYDSLDEAVSELFIGKLTTDRKNHSGEGIFFSSRIADTFVIVSSGKVFTHNRFEADSLTSETDGGILAKDLQARGTAVYIELSNHTRKHTRDVFDEFADVEGGFTRTCIPIRNYFESSPVSRSQAKRLCSRLQEFREVELDFEGMEWMGQGFAHQLFVVFAGDHLDCRLIPVNMNSDVAKMYHHVMASAKETE